MFLQVTYLPGGGGGGGGGTSWPQCALAATQKDSLVYNYSLSG